ncbi:FCS-Like Zinc finger 6 [Linum perenne]
MLLGKRRRSNMMRRTTSMSGITVDPSLPHPPADLVHGGGSSSMQRQLIENRYLASMVSPRSSLTAAETTTSHFLRTCGLCKHRIPPSKDIYMYRGDTAFCSQECREEQMKKDERKEKKTQQRSKLSTTITSNREDMFIGGNQCPTVPTSTS